MMYRQTNVSPNHSKGGFVMSSGDNFTFEDLKKIKRSHLGNNVPLELFRAVRLIGMYQGLPLQGKGTTSVVGKSIGRNLPARSVEELLQTFKDLKIGIPSVTHQDEHGLRISVGDCFCEGLPVHQGKMVCDLEGAILEGALAKILNKAVNVREVKCNVNGDDFCEYEVRIS